MKRLSSLLAGVALVVGTALSPVNAASNTQVTLPLGAIYSIQTNAVAARNNAGIYQWRRVSLEVQRIVASEHALELALPKEAAPAPAQALRQAVLDLRSAWFDHDKARTQAAADQITAQCVLLLR